MRPIDFNQQASAGPGFDIASYLQATGQVAKGKEEALSQFGSAAEKYFTEARDAESKSNALLGTVKNPELAKSIYGFDEDTAKKVVEYSKTLGSKERSMFLSSALQSAMQTNLEKEKFKNAVLIQGMQNASHLGGIGMQIDAKREEDRNRREADLARKRMELDATREAQDELNSLGALATKPTQDQTLLGEPNLSTVTESKDDKLFPMDAATKEWETKRTAHVKALGIIGKRAETLDKSAIPVLMEQAKAQYPLPQGQSGEDYFLQKNPHMKPRLDAAVKTVTGVNDVTARLGAQIALIDKTLAGEGDPADIARQLEATMKEFNTSLTPGAVSDAVAQGEGERIGGMLDTAITSFKRIKEKGMPLIGGGIDGLEKYKAMLIEQRDKVAGIGNEVMNGLARDTKPEFAEKITGYIPRNTLGGSGYVPYKYAPEIQGPVKPTGLTRESKDPKSKFQPSRTGNWFKLSGQ